MVRADPARERLKSFSHLFSPPLQVLRRVSAELASTHTSIRLFERGGAHNGRCAFRTRMTRGAVRAEFLCHVA
jgi:hypothetical protein